MTSKSLQDPAERLKQLGLSLRGRNGVDWNTTKFELRQECVRVEFFRGKDFERYFAKQEAQLQEYSDKSDSQYGKQSRGYLLLLGSGKTVEERTRELGNRFLKSGLITKAERKFKKPKPGKKRLVKWPRTLLPLPPQDGWAKEAFYVWAYDRPTSSWTYILSLLLVFAIISGCLLPIAPRFIKLCVFYTSATMLFFLLGLITIRTSAWLCVWLLTGNDFWILPNITSDEISLFEAFKPLISFKKGEGIRSHVLLRLISAVGLAIACWFLLARTPGGDKGVKERAREAHDILLDLFSLKLQLTEEGNTTTASESKEL